MKGSPAYLSLGSNLGDREDNLHRARSSVIERIGPQLSVSGIYETGPWGYDSTHLYLNCCLGVMSAMEPLQVMDELLAIEAEMGRKREAGGYRDRTIDIDLLVYGQMILDHPRLVLPHPAMAQRRFVLVPFNEIAPDLPHPVTGVTVKDMLHRCQDSSMVRLHKVG